MLWARKTLGGNWSASLTFKENHELIMRGPYGLVRHPIYSGLLMLSLGAVIFHGHLYGFIAFVF
jgi:protein-S-isoprenylcysteine O-methyltransferase Ste14